MGHRSLTIGVVGAGGDGVVMLGSLLQRLAALQGYFGHMPRYYGAQIRGGGSAIKLGVDTEILSLPKDSLDILVCFDWEKYSEFAHELTVEPGCLILCEKPPPDTSLPPGTSPLQIDFSYRSLHLMAVIGKQLIEHFYEQQPLYSYWNG